PVRRHVVGAQGQFGPASLQEGFVIAPVGLRTQCEFTQGGGFVWPSGAKQHVVHYGVAACGGQADSERDSRRDGTTDVVMGSAEPVDSRVRALADAVLTGMNPDRSPDGPGSCFRDRTARRSARS